MYMHMTEQTPDPSQQPTDDFSLESVRELLRLIGQSDITEILIERGDVKLHIKRMLPSVPGALPATPPIIDRQHHDYGAPSHAAAQHTSSERPPEEPAERVEMPAGYTISAPMVGTFYAASSPKDPAFVKEGDEIHVGDTVGIIEAMKIMNEIESDVHGKVARILAQDAQPVEYGQPLMVIEPL